MNTHRHLPRLRRAFLVTSLLAAGLPLIASTPVRAVSGAGVIAGEIERIVLNAPGDVYAGGQMVVGGQNVIIPRNLLFDLPANRLTLQQLFAQAPADCVANHETGLAKTDACNHAGAGGFATLSANRVATGDVIVGDGFIEKGIESVQGNVTYIDYADGWFLVNGRTGDPTTGVMVRLNDPGSRHTVQSGPGCLVGSANCSADPRFTLDPDNYTNAFTSGYPLCIPSTTARPASPLLPGLGANPGANASGVGDVFCPTINRGNRIAADSRRMAPVLLGDPITAEGNYETIGGVRFLSAHSSTISFGLQTSVAPGQPDYMFLEEAFIDVAGFQNQRARALFIGFATDVNPDVLGWGVHYDPESNAAHEVPLASSAGCDVAGGGCTGFGTGLFKIRYDSDFVAQPTSAKLSPCAHINSDPGQRLGSVCNDGNLAEDEFAIMSPIPHEVQFRTGRKVADVAGTLVSIDITGAASENGQYLFPFGANLGGINFPEALEFNLDLANQPFDFEGIPWNLDRRLGPGGCQALDGGGVEACESTPQPLIPFPYSEIDPRTQAGGAIAAGGAVPSGPLTDPAFTSAPLATAADRILSFIPNTAATTFGGDASVLALPTEQAVPQGITPTPQLTQTSPAFLGFDPPSGQVGSMLHLGGLGLDTATAVTINGAPALFSVLNANRLDVLVPPAASTGTIQIQTPGGTLSSATPFSVVTNPLAPTITGFSPASGDEGSQVTITGTNFTGTTSVAFGATPASAATVGGGGTSITATVPLGIGAGDFTISVVTLNGAANSATQFTVTVPPPPPPAVPTVTGFTPVSASVGASVTISGSGFLGTSAVSFNGTPATFTVLNDTTIQATVPTGATTGTVSVTTPNGTSSGGPAFTVDAPVAPVAIITPATISADQGSPVQLNGSTSTNASTFAWTQLTGPAVVMTGANTATPTFTMPNQFQNVSFRLTVANQGLTSTADVTVNAIAGTVTIDAGAQFRIGKGEWRATGTASFPGANTVTVRTGNVVGAGTVIATLPVDAVGIWTLQVRGSLVPQSSTINVVAVRGGSAVSAVTVRN
ncbi:MAG: IPT/TIG domain-containing protein [Ilumatobacteraceae bacterium]